MTESYDSEKRFNERAQIYDDEIENIIPGYRALHDISHHILKSSLPKEAYVLVGGSGTGKEAIGYALENPG
jgi:tRNA (cmo5U34)-methyltransferase